MKDSIRIVDIMDNDVIDDIGRCVSLLVQGSPNILNSSTGTEINVKKLTDIIIDKINNNEMIKNFSVLGGEPFCNDNIDQLAYIISKVREKFNDINIFVWTSDIYENLYKQIPLNESIKTVFDNIDTLIDGPYIDEKRTNKLFHTMSYLRGSENQRVIDIKTMRKLNKWNEPILYPDN